MFREDAHRTPLVVHHDHGTVRPLVDEGQCLAERVSGSEGDGGLEHGVARLHVRNHLLDDVQGDVLGQHDEPAATGDRLGHSPSGDSRHVGHDDGDVGAERIRGAEIHVQAAGHCRHAGDHEHVVVGQVVRGRALEEAHRASRDYRVGMSAPADIPVVLVHGWAGSFRETWQSTGMDALLEDGGRSVLGVDLLGHGSAEKPHDPAAYARLDQWLLEQLAPAPPVVDAVGFSLGAMTVLGALLSEPSRFGKVVLSGIGNGMLEERGADEGRKIIDALEGNSDGSDPSSQIFANYASAPGKDKQALTAVMKRPRSAPPTAEALAAVTNEVLVVIGDKDFTFPADRLASAFPNGRLVVLRNTDHFATPESFAFIDAVLEFLGAV
ncbi:MAG: hypothetical protein RJA51_133 [Actinomycetota bacterium]